MNDTQSQTESLLDIVKGIDAKSIMLPEFQRDFRWELDQTYDLFDSLVREIFIGTLIYGKPSFGLTLRQIDRRPRKGKGSNAKLDTVYYNEAQIKQRAQTHNLRVVLDGQQRITSLYRALTGLDEVWLILQETVDPAQLPQLDLEQLMAAVEGAQSAQAISVKLSDAYAAEIQGFDDDDLNARFADTNFAKTQLAQADEPTRRAATKIYRRAIYKLIDLYKQQKMVAFYLLDMSLDKFCLFFERSNSRGIQLNFTDILAAKLYHGFNLRQKIEEFDSQGPWRLNREILIRAIAYIVATDAHRPVAIDKKFILEHLDAADFERHWDSVCALYSESLGYLAAQHYILSQRWMPSENMVIPLMLFLREIKSFDQMTEAQRAFLEYWYWASIFANRYSAASNETIIVDSRVLTRVARGERIEERGYFIRMRPLIAEPSDLFSYTKRSSSVYRGLLNLLGYASHGLYDWKSKHKLDVSMDLEDHHIYPRAYISSTTGLEGIDRTEAEQLVDCVVNRTLIPKILNIQVGKKAPSVYLQELEQKNPQLGDCLESHLLPKDLLIDSTWDAYFKLFLEDRAQRIFALVAHYTIDRAVEMASQYGPLVEGSAPVAALGNPRLKDMLLSGKVAAGERVFTRKHPDRFATIVDGETVAFEGKHLSINTWGQQMTGWSSISIYENVYLERTGQPLKQLRGSEGSPSD